MPLVERAHRARQQAPCGGGEGGDEHPPGDRSLVTLQGGLRFVDDREDAFGVSHQQLGRVGQPDAAAFALQ